MLPVQSRQLSFRKKPNRPLPSRNGPDFHRSGGWNQAGRASRSCPLRKPRCRAPATAMLPATSGPSRLAQSPPTFVSQKAECGPPGTAPIFTDPESGTEQAEQADRVRYENLDAALLQPRCYWLRAVRPGSPNPANFRFAKSRTGRCPPGTALIFTAPESGTAPAERADRVRYENLDAALLQPRCYRLRAVRPGSPNPRQLSFRKRPNRPLPSRKRP